MRGFLVFDKPVGVTSHDVVAMLRAVTGIKKIGHTGTLDPFATGVLPIAFGAATRLIQFLDEDHKVYDALIHLGAATETGDPEGEVIASLPVPELTDDALDRCLGDFLGDRMQTPPKYSAVKFQGRPLYAYAREGIDVQVDARPIRIDRIARLSWTSPRLRIRVACGKGTYIRVLGEEIGAALGSVAHLTALRREESGPFTLNRALTAPALSTIVADMDDWRRALRPARGEARVPWASRESVRAALQPWLWSPLEAVATLPQVALSARWVQKVRSGQRPPPPPEAVREGGLYALAAGDELIAIARRSGRQGRLERVMAY